MMSADIDEDVPPLEDMSEELARIKFQRTQSKGVREQSDIVQPPPRQDASLKPAANVNDSKSKQVTKERGQTGRAKAKTAGDSKSSSSFGGFKKGFLVSSSDSSKSQAKREPPAPSKKKTPVATSSAEEEGSKDESDIPFIRPKEKAKSSLEFPEVQQAMKEAFPLLQSKDWVTDDLLSKIHDNPFLSEAFSDPTLGQVLSQLQSNPQAVEAAARDSPKIQKFVQEFCALMGDHFTMLADKEEKDKRADTPHISEANMSSTEEAEMREIISRAPVKDALSDPRIEQLIISLKDDPPKAQRLLRSGDEDFQRKVKILIDNELVNFQSFS